MLKFQTLLLVSLLTPPWMFHYPAATLANQRRLYNQLVHVGGCWRDSLRSGPEVLSSGWKLASVWNLSTGIYSE